MSDYLSIGELNAANPGGIPAAVSMPGGSAFAVPGITGSTFGNQGNNAGTGILPAGSSQPNLAVSTIASNPTAQASVNPGTSNPIAANAPSAGSLADYFARGIIIILGFIFIAVGLNMLRPGTVPNPIR
jgi:hypothetical protein